MISTYLAIYNLSDATLTLDFYTTETFLRAFEIFNNSNLPDTIMEARNCSPASCLPAQLRLRFSGVGAIGTRVLLLDVVMDQSSMGLQLGCGTKNRWTTRKAALVFLTGVSQHVLSKGMSTIHNTSITVLYFLNYTTVTASGRT